jgi:DNA-directed RNA polymerase subunit RPC12/RpoP
MASSVGKTPKRYITFKVITEITLSETDIQELCQHEKRLTAAQLKLIFKSLDSESTDTGEGAVLEVDGDKRKEPGECVRERILDEIDNLDPEIKCFECGKKVVPDDEDGLWDYCSGGDTYKCERCCNPPEEQEEEEAEEADDGESSDKN